MKAHTEQTPLEQQESLILSSLHGLRFLIDKKARAAGEKKLWADQLSRAGLANLAAVEHKAALVALEAKVALEHHADTLRAALDEVRAEMGLPPVSKIAPVMLTFTVAGNRTLTLSGSFPLDAVPEYVAEVTGHFQGWIEAELQWQVTPAALDQLGVGEGDAGLPAVAQSEKSTEPALHWSPDADELGPFEGDFSQDPESPLLT